VGLSLACNILDNVDRAIKYGKIIREIYASTSGLPNQLQLLDDAAQSMSVVADELEKTAASILQTETDIRMRDVSKECGEVCRAIRALLTKCKPTVPNSALSSAVARLRISLNKGDIEGFQVKLQECSRSLNSLVAAKTS